jgi:hypothetical protein
MHLMLVAGRRDGLSTLSSALYLCAILFRSPPSSSPPRIPQNWHRGDFLGPARAATAIITPFCKSGNYCYLCATDVCVSVPPSVDGGNVCQTPAQQQEDCGGGGGILDLHFSLLWVLRAHLLAVVGIARVALFPDLEFDTLNEFGVASYSDNWVLSWWIFLVLDHNITIEKTRRY